MQNPRTTLLGITITPLPLLGIDWDPPPLPLIVKHLCAPAIPITQYCVPSPIPMLPPSHLPGAALSRDPALLPLSVTRHSLPQGLWLPRVQPLPLPRAWPGNSASAAWLSTPRRGLGRTLQQRARPRASIHLALSEIVANPTQIRAKLPKLSFWTIFPSFSVFE